MGLLDFIHSSNLFLLTFPFGSVNVGAKPLVSFLSCSCKAINSSADKSKAALDVFTDDRSVVVVMKAAAASSTSGLFWSIEPFSISASP